MDHVFVNAAPARVVVLRTNREVIVSELAPDAQHLHALSLIAID
jgi:hypothetical protein